ncbi:MAG: hypothetical protein JXR70_03690 [Spirochaetales bacterium]|nr:hypothetical protein [Spirochaetales bacterium]
MFRKNQWLVAIITGIFMISCAQKTIITIEDIDPELAARSITHLSRGLISTESTVLIRFNDTMAPGDLLGKALSPSPFHFNPAIAGEARWKDGQTLVFTPMQRLPQNKKYKGYIDLDLLPRKIFSGDLLGFSFSTLGQSLVSLDAQLEPESQSDTSRFYLSGKVVLSEPVTMDRVKSALTFVSGFDSPPLTIQESSDNRSFQFSSKLIPREAKSREYKLNLAAGPLNLDKNFAKPLLLPGKDQFSITGVDVHKAEQDPVIKLSFTEALDPSQNLVGLINLEPPLEHKLSIIGREVYIQANFQRGEDIRVRVNSAVKNQKDVHIEKDTELDIAIPDVKPQMAFMSDGAYLPTDNHQRIRFQTINLKRVRLEVTRIFDNNVFQFLQTEQLHSSKDRNSEFNDYYVNRVGLVIETKVLEIGDTKNQWLQQEINLSNIIKDNDLGFYLVYLSFERGDMIWESTNESYSDYYNDPNSWGYIYGHGRIYKPISVSDIGLTYKAAANGHFIYATHLKDATRLSGVKINLKTYQNQLIESAVTDKDGKVLFENVNQDVFYVEAFFQNQRSIIKLNEMAWNISSFNISGEEGDAAETRAFMYTERGVYRPGDAVNLSAIIRNQDNTFPANHPVTLELYNPKNQLVKSIIQKNGIDGFYHFELMTSQDDPTGNWLANLKAGSSVFQHTIKIETVVPYKLKVLIETDNESIGPETRTLEARIESKYLFGNPASGLKAEASVEYTSLAKHFEDYPGFTFTNEAVQFSRVKDNLFNSYLDDQGSCKIYQSLPDFSMAPSAIRATITAQVYEKGGRPNKNSRSITIDPFERYVGIEKPDFQWGTQRMGNAMELRAVLVNTKGKAVPGETLTYRVYKNDRYWWWEYDSRDEYQLRYKSDSNTVLVDQGTVRSSASPVFFRYTPKEWGEYLIEISDPQGHSAGFFFWSSRWGETPGTDAGVIALSSDKAVYRPGDIAEISFPQPGEGVILLTMERGNKILSDKWFPIKSKNEFATIKVPITDEMVPTVYASVSIIQPHIQTKNDRPIRMYGIIPLNVEQSSTHQDLDIIMNQQLKPETEFTVAVQNRSKKKTQLSIAVVDEGLLDLTNFITPDAWKYFFAKQRLGVMTYDIFNDVIGAHKGDVFKTFSVGGGYDQGVYDADGGQKKRFEPVSLFSGIISTDSSGYARVSFKMPNYVGSVRVMVVSADKNSYGKAEKTVPVKSELMVLPSLPRILGPDEEFYLPITLFSTEDSIRQIITTIKTEGPLSIVGPSTQTIEVNGKGEKDIQFLLRTDNRIGQSKITLSSSAGRFSASNETNILVRPSSPRIYDTQEKAIRPGETVTMTIPDSGLPGSMRAELSLVKLPKLNLSHRFRWLIHYPYGCIEQTTSSVFPQLYLKEFADLSEQDQRAIDENINAGIRRLQQFVTPDGGFAYWPGQTQSSIWGTNYAGHFLLEAKVRGYHVPESMLDNWKRFQASQALTTRDNLKERVYRLYLLSLANASALGPMNLLKEDSLSSMTNTEKWLLAGAYELAGNSSLASQILRNLDITVEDYFELGGTYGSSIRDRAMILDMLLLFNRWSQAHNLFRDLADEISSENWYSTQSVAYNLLAMGKFITQNNSNENSIMKGQMKLPFGHTFDFNSSQAKVTRVLNEGFGEKFSLTLDKYSSVKVAYVSLEWEGVPLKPEIQEEAKNLKLSVRYLDEGGRVIDPTNIPQGTSFYGHIVARKDSSGRRSLEEMALTQIFPSGWEIDNLRLSGESLPDWTKNLRLNREEYLDIRDDRIMWFFDMAYYDDYYDFVFKINAVTKGDFILPPTVFEAMYNSKDYQAIDVFGPQESGIVKVIVSESKMSR